MPTSLRARAHAGFGLALALVSHHPPIVVPQRAGFARRHDRGLDQQEPHQSIPSLVICPSRGCSALACTRGANPRWLARCLPLGKHSICPGGCKLRFHNRVPRLLRSAVRKRSNRKRWRAAARQAESRRRPSYRSWLFGSGRSFSVGGSGGFCAGKLTRRSGLAKRGTETCDALAVRLRPSRMDGDTTPAYNARAESYFTVGNVWPFDLC
jgi:hypothetical protein